MKKLVSILFALIWVCRSFAQDEPFENQPKNTVQLRGDCIEVLNQAEFFSGEFGGGQGTKSICFSFPSTCGAEISMNSNSVVDFLQFHVDGDTSGIIGVGSSGFDNLEYLSVGEVVLIPFNFSPTRAFKGPIHVDAGPDGFIIEKLGSGASGDMFVTVNLENFSVTLLSNTNFFTNYRIQCTPLNICLDYVAYQYYVACPNEDLSIESKCYDSDYKTIWVNPYGDTTLCDKDTLKINNPVPVGLYKWFTPCNKGYVMVYHPDSIMIDTQQVLCSSKKKLSLPVGLKGDWSTGAKNTNYIYVTEPGTYWADVNNCAQDSIAVDIFFQSLDLELHFVPDVDTLLFTEELNVGAASLPDVNISWRKNDRSVFAYYGPGFYTITGVLDECVEHDTLLIIPKLFSGCDWDVYAPNIFSPNDDGDNDSFEVFGPSGSTSNVWVYDRWGELMFEGDKWDGTHKGLPCNPGVYVFSARVVLGFEQCSSIKGDVTIIR